MQLTGQVLCTFGINQCAHNSSQKSSHLQWAEQWLTETWMAPNAAQQLHELNGEHSMMSKCKTEENFLFYYGDNATKAPLCFCYLAWVSTQMREKIPCSFPSNPSKIPGCTREQTNGFLTCISGTIWCYFPVPYVFQILFTPQQLCRTANLAMSMEWWLKRWKFLK